MKKRMKRVFWLIVFLAANACSYSQTIEIKAGKSLFPADYVALRYNHYTNSQVNLSGGIFFEKTKRYSLNYSALGIELLGQYDTGLGEISGHRFECRAGLGGTWQIENEPWVYKDWPAKRRMNYGVLAEATGEWMMTETFGLSAFAQQMFLLNRDLGNSRFVFGLGISYHFNNN